MDKREVTEFDLRAEEFKHPSFKPSDYEFRSDGKIVRKDRWEQGIRSLVEPAGFSLREFEIDAVVESITAKLQALDAFDFSKLRQALSAAAATIQTQPRADITLVQDINDLLVAVEALGAVLQDQTPDE